MIVVDTGVLLSAVSSTDRHHRECAELLPLALVELSASCDRVHPINRSRWSTRWTSCALAVADIGAGCSQYPTAATGSEPAAATLFDIGGRSVRGHVDKHRIARIV